MSEAPTLYEWAGGREAIERMIGCFYDRVERDDLLSPLFPGGVGAAHREHVTTWWCEVFGGPAGYTERLGGYPAMLARHRDLGITADQRFRFASLMSLAADDADLPADPEFRAALVGYLEWGTRLAMHNSQYSRPRCPAGAGVSPRPTGPDRSGGGGTGPVAVNRTVPVPPEVLAHPVVLYL